MKKIYIIIATSLFILIITPSIALASWWNPISWWDFFFHKAPESVIVENNISIQEEQAQEKFIKETMKKTTEVEDTIPLEVKEEIELETEAIYIEPVEIKGKEVKKTLKEITAEIELKYKKTEQTRLEKISKQLEEDFKAEEEKTVKVTETVMEEAPEKKVKEKCNADKWSCDDWDLCSSSGSKTRTCNITSECSSVETPSPSTSQSCTPTPKELMPDKPIIDSFCDNKGNCVHSQFADINSNSFISPEPTIHVGETLNFTIKVSGQEASGVFGFILQQGYDSLKEGGKKPWSNDLTYSKTFSVDDISTSGYPVYAYIKSKNDNYHRRSRGCNWIDYACDDSATLYYTVLP